MLINSLLFFMFGLSGNTQLSYDNFIVRYDRFERTNYSLEISKQLPVEYKSRTERIHYEHLEYELLHLDGKSSFYATGKVWYPDTLGGIYDHFNRGKDESIVFKDFIVGVTKQDNTLYPGKCRVFSHDKISDDWVITNEVKKIQGFITQKAYLKNNTDRTAWFTPGISVSDGPFNASGLPGLILEWNDKRLTYRAISVEQLSESNDLTLPMPNCIEELSISEYNKQRIKLSHE